jgi:hypothetical protein
MSGRVTYNPATGRCQWAQYSASPGRALYAGEPLTRILNVSWVSSNHYASTYTPGFSWTGLWIDSHAISCELVIRLANAGTGALTVTSVTSNSVWNLDWTSGVISPGGYRDITCTYSFSDPIDTGHCMFGYATNATSGNDFIIKTRLKTT